MRGPAIRANVERAFYGLLVDDIPEAQRRDLETAKHSRGYESAKNASLFGWIPLALAVELRESLRQLAGDDDRFISLMESWALKSTQRQPFKAITEALFRIYDRNPQALLQAYGTVWKTTYRSVGTYVVERSDEYSASISIRGACTDAQPAAFRLYSLGILRAVVVLGGGTPMGCTQELVDDTIHLELCWTLPAPDASSSFVR